MKKGEYKSLTSAEYEAKRIGVKEDGGTEENIADGEEKKNA